MFWGIISGFTTALLNTVGYIFGSRFLLYYKNPFRLLTMASFVMMFLSLPLAIFFCPFRIIPDFWNYLGKVILAGISYLIAQCSFFAAMQYFEASRISSLLSLKIIVLSIIFIICGGSLNFLQLMAVATAAVAAMIFNWSGAQKNSLKGWIWLLLTLIFYSLEDIIETELVMQMHNFTGYSKLHSAIITVPLMYSVLGVITAPLLFFFKPDKEQIKKVFPYAALWLISQMTLLCCYAFLQPVFGNVILSTRGIFSVIAGILLSYFGLSALDSQIPVRLWLRRIIAAIVMLGAIIMYSFA